MSPQANRKEDPVFTNGVNVTALMDTITAIKGNPDIAKFQFRATNVWEGGDRNRSTVKEFTGACMQHRVGEAGFEFSNGEHPVLLGHDEAPNPVEWLLHALIGCVTTTIAYHAAARGIEVRAISSTIDGDLDLHGFLGLAQDVRKGYSNIRIAMTIASDASPTTLKGLAQMSPVLDVVSRSVPVDLTIATR